MVIGKIFVKIIINIIFYNIVKKDECKKVNTLILNRLININRTPTPLNKETCKPAFNFKTKFRRKGLILEQNTKIRIMSPVIHGEKGTFKDLLDQYRKDGYVRIRIDNVEYDLSESIELSKTKKHNIEVIIDRLIIKEGIRSRLYESIENACKLSKGKVLM